MAEIPVEEKSGKGWLWVLLALLAILVLVLLAWWLLADDDDDAIDYTANEAVVTAPAETGAAQTAAAAGALAIGDSVDLENVRVTSLAGDMAFNAEVNGQTMLVVFNQQPTPDDATEGEYDINPGSMVNIEGSVRSASEPLPAGVTAQMPSGADRYIFADSIEMAS